MKKDVMGPINTGIRNLRINVKARSVMELTDSNSMVVVTRRLKPRGWDKKGRQEYVVTIGPPNYKARKLIKRAKKHHFEFPLQDIRYYKDK